MKHETTYKPKVSESKHKQVQDLIHFFTTYPIIGIVNMENLPARQLQNMRSQLGDRVVIRMAKKNVIKFALKEANKSHLDELVTSLQGMPALLFSKEDPFKLYKILKKNKSKAPIKGGQVAPADIIVQKGPTGFAPGPIIGELGQFKIKAGIDAGKVAIKEDSLVAHKGDIVNAKLAGLLTRLGIEPVDIGLNLVTIYQNGEIIPASVLDIDETEYINKIIRAAGESFALAVEISYPNKDTITVLLAKSYIQAKSLGIDRSIASKDTIQELLAKALLQANQLDK
jgi:large subunit ribosomal protein L10